MTAPTPPGGRARKYRVMCMDALVYVDSGCDYHGTAHYIDTTTGRHWAREYCWDLFEPLGVQMPKYIEDEFERLWLELLKSGLARFYEYDQDHNMRFDALRYYDPADVRRIIEALERREGGGA